MPTLNDPPLLRTSERGDAGRCPWLWWQVWRKGLRPLREPTWAVFGTAWHRGLEHYYQPGTKRAPIEETIEVFLEDLELQGRKIGVDIEDLEEEERAKAEAKGKDAKLVPARELGPEMLRAYERFYNGNRSEWYNQDKDWEVIHTEQTFQINVPDPDFAGETLVVYCGTWDALMRHIPSGRLWLWDHKSAKSIPSPGFLELNNQVGSYPWVAKEVLVHKGILTKKDRIHGIIFNYAKKSPPDSRPTNAAGESLNKPTKAQYVAALTGKPLGATQLRRYTVEELAELASKEGLVVQGEVSKVQPAKRFERYPSPRTPQQNANHAKRVQDEAIKMQMMRNGEIPITKTPSYDCERCVLFDLCTMHESGDDWEFYRDETFKVRDPYRDHREAMEQGGIHI